MSDPTTPPAAARCAPAKPRRTRQLAICPAPHGACSHPEICQSHGCAVWESRGNIARAEAKQREATIHAAALHVVDAARRLATKMAHGAYPLDVLDEIEAVEDAVDAFDAAQQKEPTP